MKFYLVPNLILKLNAFYWNLSFFTQREIDFWIFIIKKVKLKLQLIFDQCFELWLAINLQFTTNLATNGIPVDCQQSENLC